MVEYEATRKGDHQWNAKIVMGKFDKMTMKHTLRNGRIFHNINITSQTLKGTST